MEQALLPELLVVREDFWPLFDAEQKRALQAQINRMIFMEVLFSSRSINVDSLNLSANYIVSQAESFDSTDLLAGVYTFLGKVPGVAAHLEAIGLLKPRVWPCKYLEEDERSRPLKLLLDVPLFECIMHMKPPNLDKVGGLSQLLLYWWLASYSSDAAGSGVTNSLASLLSIATGPSAPNAISGEDLEAALGIASRVVQHYLRPVEDGSSVLYPTKAAPESQETLSMLAANLSSVANAFRSHGVVTVSSTTWIAACSAFYPLVHSLVSYGLHSAGRRAIEGFVGLLSVLSDSFLKLAPAAYPDPETSGRFEVGDFSIRPQYYAVLRVFLDAIDTNSLHLIVPATRRCLRPLLEFSSLVEEGFCYACLHRAFTLSAGPIRRFLAQYLTLFGSRFFPGPAQVGAGHRPISLEFLGKTYLACISSPGAHVLLRCDAAREEILRHSVSVTGDVFANVRFVHEPVLVSLETAETLQVTVPEVPSQMGRSGGAVPRRQASGPPARTPTKLPHHSMEVRYPTLTEKDLVDLTLSVSTVLSNLSTAYYVLCAENGDFDVFCPLYSPQNLFQKEAGRFLRRCILDAISTGSASLLSLRPSWKRDVSQFLATTPNISLASVMYILLDALYGVFCTVASLSPSQDEQNDDALDLLPLGSRVWGMQKASRPILGALYVRCIRLLAASKVISLPQALSCLELCLGGLDFVIEELSGWNLCDLCNPVVEGGLDVPGLSERQQFVLWLLQTCTRLDSSDSGPPLDCAQGCAVTGLLTRALQDDTSSILELLFGACVVSPQRIVCKVIGSLADFHSHASVYLRDFTFSPQEAKATSHDGTTSAKRDLDALRLLAILCSVWPGAETASLVTLVTSRLRLDGGKPFSPVVSSNYRTDILDLANTSILLSLPYFDIPSLELADAIWNWKTVREEELPYFLASVGLLLKTLGSSVSDSPASTNSEPASGVISSMSSMLQALLELVDEVSMSRAKPRLCAILGQNVFTQPLMKTSARQPELKKVVRELFYTLYAQSLSCYVASYGILSSFIAAVRESGTRQVLCGFLPEIYMCVTYCVPSLNETEYRDVSALSLFSKQVYSEADLYTMDSALDCSFADFRLRKLALEALAECFQSLDWKSASVVLNDFLRLSGRDLDISDLKLPGCALQRIPAGASLFVSLNDYLARVLETGRCTQSVLRTRDAKNELSSLSFASVLQRRKLSLLKALRMCLAICNRMDRSVSDPAVISEMETHAKALYQSLIRPGWLKASRDCGEQCVSLLISLMGKGDAQSLLDSFGTVCGTLTAEQIYSAKPSLLQSRVVILAHILTQVITLVRADLLADPNATLRDSALVSPRMSEVLAELLHYSVYSAYIVRGLSHAVLERLCELFDKDPSSPPAPVPAPTRQAITAGLRESQVLRKVFEVIQQDTPFASRLASPWANVHADSTGDRRDVAIEYCNVLDTIFSRVGDESSQRRPHRTEEDREGEPDGELGRKACKGKISTDTICAVNDVGDYAAGGVREADENSNSQRKIDVSAGEVRDRMAERGSKQLIVCASLLEKTANLGGIARTSEIFGCTKLVVPDLSVREDPGFLAMAMTAESWLDMEEVKPEVVGAFLAARKAEGYTIVALEQSERSVSLDKVALPERAVLLLGNERTGCPDFLLRQCDLAVEIPQFGLIRSLNVHVSCALMVWEWARQTLLPRPQEAGH